MAIEITDFRPFDKNTLKGFATIRMTNIGLEIRDLALHEKGDQRWFQMPSKPYEKDGAKTWSYIINFFDKAMREKFQAAALKALDEYRQLDSGDTGYAGF